MDGRYKKGVVLFNEEFTGEKQDKMEWNEGL